MATNYKFGGSNVPGMEVNRLIMKGSSTNPDESVEMGGIVELSDDQVKMYRSQGLKFTKTDDEPDGNSGDGAPETQAEQAAAQAETAQPGAQTIAGRGSTGRTK